MNAQRILIADRPLGTHDPVRRLAWVTLLGFVCICRRAPRDEGSGIGVWVQGRETYLAPLIASDFRKLVRPLHAAALDVAVREAYLRPRVYFRVNAVRV
jgi:hypothetical protein